MNTGRLLAVCIENLIIDTKYSELSPSKNGDFLVSSNRKWVAELPLKSLLITSKSCETR